MPVLTLTKMLRYSAHQGAIPLECSQRALHVHQDCKSDIDLNYVFTPSHTMMLFVCMQCLSIYWCFNNDCLWFWLLFTWQSVLLHCLPWRIRVPITNNGYSVSFLIYHTDIIYHIAGKFSSQGELNLVLVVYLRHQNPFILAYIIHMHGDPLPNWQT